MTRKKAYQQALEGAGIPPELADKAAEIINRDDPKKPDLGRSKEDQELINQSIKFISK
jgi:hypothetical protein